MRDVAKVTASLARLHAEINTSPTRVEAHERSDARGLRATARSLPKLSAVEPKPPEWVQIESDLEAFDYESAAPRELGLVCSRYISLHCGGETSLGFHPLCSHASVGAQRRRSADGRRRHVHRFLPSRYRLPLVVLDATGMRLGEIEAPGRHDPFAGCWPDWNLTTSAEP